MGRGSWKYRFRMDSNPRTRAPDQKPYRETFERKVATESQSSKIHDLHATRPDPAGRLNSRSSTRASTPSGQANSREIMGLVVAVAP